MARTEIIATLGPSTESVETLRALVDAGMDVARLNFSHGSYEHHQMLADRMREAGNVLIMQDLQGPKIRVGQIAEPITVEAGEEINFCTESEVGCIPVPYDALAEIVKPGHRILINDGLIQCEVLEAANHHVKAKVTDGGVISSRKGLNIPDSELPGDAKLSEKDLADLKFGIQTLKVDVVALSFVETAEDITHLRDEITKLTDRPVKICAKIERPQALENLDAIIEVSDWIMVARGDLGIEIEPEKVPVAQRDIVKKSREAGKYVIIATQILQSMVENPLPTRAEISDAATAVFEHADAVMLSNETATGKYPVEAVDMLEKVAQDVEKA